MNPAEEKEILQREQELKNLQNGIFHVEQAKEEVPYYNPNLEELKRNSSLKPKLIKGLIFCK